MFIRGPSGVLGSGTGVTASSCLASLHEDTLGAHWKSALAQYVALELSRPASGSGFSVSTGLISTTGSGTGYASVAASSLFGGNVGNSVGSSGFISDQDVLPFLAPGLLADFLPPPGSRYFAAARGVATTSSVFSENSSGVFTTNSATGYNSIHGQPSVRGPVTTFSLTSSTKTKAFFQLATVSSGTGNACAPSGPVVYVCDLIGLHLPSFRYNGPKAAQRRTCSYLVSAS
ncbi:unnamed protein product [Protopolystoma xenopodis]|uniref:Uncharacterized protein n=1 Tax=Protopolystoma xenopodis TaxID=117903 RepID=A0A3S5CRE5_9PLAT|nr:unnamed protein product [Protopolystoma xenopodis]